MFDSMKMISEASDRRHALTQAAQSSRLARLAKGEGRKPRSRIASRAERFWHVLTHLNKIQIKIIVDYGEVVPDTAR